MPESPAWSSAGPDDIEDRPGGTGFDVRFVPGQEFGAAGVRRAWCRENRPLVEGDELTSFQRAALVADFANPFANAGEQGLDYINADITLYVGRLPVGEWIGIETTEHVAANGIATSSCRLHDLSGPIGTSAAASVLTPRMPGAGVGSVRSPERRLTESGCCPEHGSGIRRSPSTLVTITDPSPRNSLGSRAKPTPPGVPVAITSPGSSVMMSLM